MKIVADCPFRGFHSHVSRGKLFGPALSIIFVDTSVTTIDMRSSGDLPSPLMPPADGIQLDHATPGQEPNQTAPPAAAPVSETGQRDAKGVGTCDITATEQDAMRPRYDAAPAGTVNSFSRLRRLAVKLEKYKSHRDFLETCTADGLIPRGFRLTWKCHFDDQNEEVERTLEKASQELVRISAEVAAARVTHLEGEYQTLSEQVGANATRDEQAHSAVIVQKDVQRTKDFTTRTKKRKLDRLRPNQRSQTAGDGPGQTPRPPEPVGVVNLSSRQLTPTELALLTRGLSFVPSRKQTVAQLTAELKEWERLMRLREFWHNSNDNQPREANDTEDAAYKKAKWVPPKGRDPWLDLYLEEVTTSVLRETRSRGIGNLSADEEEALSGLIKDDDIVIRPADKGSSVTIMNTADYIDKLNREMADASTYRPVNEDNTTAINKKVMKLASELYQQGYIGRHQKAYLAPPNPRPGRLQGNPKLHKPGAPLRVIVSGVGHATERVAEAAEEQLRTHVENQPSFIKDTSDFINKLQKVPQPVTDQYGHIPLLFCMDVKKLYPSVPRGKF
ncbi:hypothetical protein FJT64_014057 [Amphibalanus amphitrite]|uniref:Reverse transcriptase domain-containing protein n=1 Tax=Amphibalanus amphitrite TaxID=1232801 RepID=A0A6A4V366_AMPAM|nr:hypothetical protein FJT64_014057 [Amphibalanus amphitrite]